MDRETFISYLTSYVNHELKFEDAKRLLTAYCTERGKPDDDLLQEFVGRALAMNPFYLNYMMEWYISKYQVNILYKPTPGGGRQIILIY